MSPDTIPCRTLAEYVAALLDRLGKSDPDSLRRMREVVGARRARIVLDHEVIEVAFGPQGLEIDGPGGSVDGEGATDRNTVLAILDGRLEATDAVLEGRVRVAGEPGNVARMLQAIEILLDGASRVPELQALAHDFRHDPCREPPARHGAKPYVRQTPWFPRERSPAEDALLRRLRLLPSLRSDSSA